MIFFSNRDLGLTNSKLNTALRSKGTAWALAFLLQTRARFRNSSHGVRTLSLEKLLLGEIPLKSKLKRIKMSEAGFILLFLIGLIVGFILRNIREGNRWI